MQCPRKLEEGAGHLGAAVTLVLWSLWCGSELVPLQGHVYAFAAISLVLEMDLMTNLRILKTKISYKSFKIMLVSQYSLNSKY